MGVIDIRLSTESRGTELRLLLFAWDRPMDDSSSFLRQTRHAHSHSQLRLLGSVIRVGDSCVLNRPWQRMPDSMDRFDVGVEIRNRRSILRDSSSRHLIESTAVWASHLSLALQVLWLLSHEVVSRVMERLLGQSMPLLLRHFILILAKGLESLQVLHVVTLLSNQSLFQGLVNRLFIHNSTWSYWSWLLGLCLRSGMLYESLSLS